MTAAPSQTWGAAQRTLAARFAQARLDSPDADARMLLIHVLGTDSLGLVRDHARVLTSEQAKAIENAAVRRLAHEPVSRIIGERWFYGRPFTITPATLDPRPDSETLIDAVLAYVRENRLTTEPLRLLDIGTGTGCLLLTLLAELPGASGVGTDISAEALAVAARNAERHAVTSDRVSWRLGADFEPVDGRFNIILTNPPYIPSAEIEMLDADVRAYDPLTALDGGPDGLDIYRRLADSFDFHLAKPMAYAIFELGAGQAPAVAALLRAACTTPHEISTHKDLAGIERCVAIRTRAATSHST